MINVSVVATTSISKALSKTLHIYYNFLPFITETFKILDKYNEPKIKINSVSVITKLSNY